MNISPETFEAIRAHFCSVYPNEGCGLLLQDGSYVPCDNVSQSPKTHFAIDDAVYEQYEDEVVAVLHSHVLTDAPVATYALDPRTPSGQDIEGHISSGKLYGITCCDGENIEHFIFLGESHLEPLEGRNFIHGYTDCYAACRDWYRVERNIIIPEFVRDFNWWTDDKKDLYMDGFTKAGFYVIDEADAKVGDAILFRIASRQVNHAGVINGDGTVLHHLFGRLSCTERYEKYRKGIIAFLRHKDLNQEEAPCSEPSSSTEA